MVEGAATTEHCQNTALHVWEIPGKSPNQMTGGLQNRSWDFLRIICEQQRLER